MINQLKSTERVGGYYRLEQRPDTYTDKVILEVTKTSDRQLRDEELQSSFQLGLSETQKSVV